jgi:hypothetical protein
VFFRRNEVGLRKIDIPPVPAHSFHVFLIASESARRVEALLLQVAPELKIFVGLGGNHQGDFGAIDQDLKNLRCSSAAVLFGDPGAVSNSHTQVYVKHARLHGKPTVVINPGVVFASLLDECPIELVSACWL